MQRMLTRRDRERRKRAQEGQLQALVSRVENFVRGVPSGPHCLAVPQGPGSALDKMTRLAAADNRVCGSRANERTALDVSQRPVCSRLGRGLIIIIARAGSAQSSRVRECVRVGNLFQRARIGGILAVLAPCCCGCLVAAERSRFASAEPVWPFATMASN